MNPSGEPQAPNATNRLHIRTGARIHFGLVDVVAPFGGAGIMIDHPSTEIDLRPADRQRVSADADTTTRVQKLVDSFPFPETRLPPRFHLRVLRRPPAHHGLGSGTQLAMAICEALWHWCGSPGTTDWVAAAGRGARSMVGTLGYRRGGLIVDGQSEFHHTALPAAWRVLVLRPSCSQTTIHGVAEDARFDQLSASPRADSARMRALIQKELLPAGRAGDFPNFAAAATHLNRLSGELFRPVQNGIFQSPEVATLIHKIETIDPRLGVGQSSWGPGVFVLCPDEAVARETWSAVSSQAEKIAISAISRDGRSLS